MIDVPTESGRIAEVLHAAAQAYYTDVARAHVQRFTIWRVSPEHPTTRATPVRMTFTLHPGDHGETVATIARAATVRAGWFHLTRQPWVRYQAAAFTRRAGRLSPVVTPEVLDVLRHPHPQQRRAGRARLAHRQHPRRAAAGEVVTAAPITAQPAALITPPAAPVAAPPQDAAVLDAIAWTLAVSPDWSADELTVIADLIGTVRPHPGELDPDAPDWVGQLAAYRLQLTHRNSVLTGH